MYTVSVIIPTYNYGHFISEAIESVLHQTYKDFEIIIVDDGSTDKTCEVIEKFGSKIKYFYQKNAGLPFARNKGIIEATGKYIALLDSDDLWLPQKLDTQVPILDKYANVGLVFSDYFVNDGSLQRVICYTDMKANRLNTYHRLLFGNFIPCPTALFRKECISNIGTFDEHLSRLGSEDWDMWLRIARKYDIAHIPRPLAIYRCHHNSMVTNVHRMLQSQLYVVDKIFNLDPHLRRQHKYKRQVISHVYYKIGKIFYMRLELKDARKSILSALRYNPFLYKAYDCLLRCLLGAKIISLIRKYCTRRCQVNTSNSLI